MQAMLERPSTDAKWDVHIQTLNLSPRQTKVVGLILRGKRDKEIAADLNLSKHTIRTYLKRLFDRFDVSDRTGLVIHVLGNFPKRCPQEECPFK